MFRRLILVLFIDLLRVFESKANFRVWSLLTVIAIGETKYCSRQLVSFSTRLSSNNFLISVLTPSCKLRRQTDI